MDLEAFAIHIIIAGWSCCPVSRHATYCFEDAHEVIDKFFLIAYPVKRLS